MKSRAKIVQGRWTRRVTWEKNGKWRTDMFKSVLRDDRLKQAVFLCEGGPTITIGADELRAVLPKLHEHYGGAIWGPFDIDPGASTIDGHHVNMTVI